MSPFLNIRSFIGCGFDVKSGVVSLCLPASPSAFLQQSTETYGSRLYPWPKPTFSISSHRHPDGAACNCSRALCGDYGTDADWDNTVFGVQTFATGIIRTITDSVIRRRGPA